MGFIGEMNRWTQWRVKSSVALAGRGLNARRELRLEAGATQERTVG